MALLMEVILYYCHAACVYFEIKVRTVLEYIWRKCWYKQFWTEATLTTLVVHKQNRPWRNIKIHAMDNMLSFISCAFFYHTLAFWVYLLYWEQSYSFTFHFCFLFYLFLFKCVIGVTLCERFLVGKKLLKCIDFSLW